MQKINHYTQPNPTNPLPHAIKYSGFFLAFSTQVAVAIIFCTFPPAEVPSAMPQPQVLQLDLRRVNKRNRKGLSRAIHVIFRLPKIGGVICEISSKEHEGPSSLLLTAPHVYILDTKAILVSAVLLSLYASRLYYCTSCFAGGWMVYYAGTAVQLYHNITCCTW